MKKFLLQKGGFNLCANHSMPIFYKYTVLLLNFLALTLPSQLAQTKTVTGTVNDKTGADMKNFTEATLTFNYNLRLIPQLAMYADKDVKLEQNPG